MSDESPRPPRREINDLTYAQALEIHRILRSNRIEELSVIVPPITWTVRPERRGWRGGSR
jgi:hypothetical protein